MGDECNGNTEWSYVRVFSPQQSRQLCRAFTCNLLHAIFCMGHTVIIAGFPMLQHPTKNCMQ